MCHHRSELSSHSTTHPSVYKVLCVSIYDAPCRNWWMTLEYKFIDAPNGNILCRSNDERSFHERNWYDLANVEDYNVTMGSAVCLTLFPSEKIFCFIQNENILWPNEFSFSIKLARLRCVLGHHSFFFSVRSGKWNEIPTIHLMAAKLKCHRNANTTH